MQPGAWMALPAQVGQTGPSSTSPVRVCSKTHVLECLGCALPTAATLGTGTLSQTPLASS